MQRLSQLFSELKRRNVFRAGAAYVVLAWLTIQVADILLDAFAAPDWVLRTLIVALSLGFPLTLFLSWVYEITVEGVKRTEDVTPYDSITDRTGRKLDFVVIGLLSVAVALFAIDRFLWQQFQDDVGSASYDFSVAVLPFESASDQIAMFFGQLSNDVTLLLRRSKQLRIVSADAIDALPTAAKLSEIADRVGVRYVVTGAMNTERDGISLSVSIFDNESKDEIWTKIFDNAQLQGTISSLVMDISRQIGVDEPTLPSEATDPRAFELYLRARQHDAIESEWGEAEGLYREAIEIDSRFSPALAGMCSHFVRKYKSTSASKDFQEAETHCYRAWTVDEHSADVHLALGHLYARSGQIDRARQSLESVLEIQPNDMEAQVALAGTYYDSEPELAESQLKKIIQQHPGSPDAYMSLQFLYFKQGRYSEAVEQARWAVRLRPNEPGIKYRLTSNLLLAGMFDEARGVLEEILEAGSVESGYLADAENNLAAVLFFEGDYDGAAKLYRTAIDRRPEEATYYRGLGDALWHSNGNEVARPVFMKVIDVANQQLGINPNYYFAIGSLIVAYASVGDASNSQLFGERAINSDAHDPQAHYDIAIAASRLEDLAMAQRHASKAKELGYPIAWLRADPDLQAIGVSFD